MTDILQRQRHLGTRGDIIIVEGNVVRVDYVVRGNPRRYVISTTDGEVVYEGPVLPVGWSSYVRFSAIIRWQEYSHAGQVHTLVENARDVVVIRRPPISGNAARLDG